MLRLLSGIPGTEIPITIELQWGSGLRGQEEELSGAGPLLSRLDETVPSDRVDRKGTNEFGQRKCRRPKSVAALCSRKSVILQQKKLVVTELEQTENGKKCDPLIFLKDETDFHPLRRRPGETKNRCPCSEYRNLREDGTAENKKSKAMEGIPRKWHSLGKRTSQTLRAGF